MKNMKVFIFSILAAVAANNTFAQNTGIGTITPATTLDVNGGFTLRETGVAVAANAVTIPVNVSQIRITGIATDTVAVNAPAAPNAGQTLTVYNNTTGGFGAALNGVIVANGQMLVFTYTNGGWRAADNGMSANGNAKNWKITGNGGTVNGTNFIGTTDNVPLDFRVNNQNAGRIVSGSNANTALGYQSMDNSIPNNVGNNNSNTAFGYQSMSTNVTGNQNTAIGSGADVTASFLVNATAIGYNAKVNASNKIRLGNSSVLVIEAERGFTATSDGRFKKDVSQADIPGLDFILRLKPVSYNFDYPGFSKFLGEKDMDAEALATKAAKRELGFIAQDVERLVDETGVTFNAVYAPQNDKDNYSLSYMHFVMPLVRGMQEQQAKIQKLEAQNAMLSAQVAKQDAALAEIQAEVTKLLPAKVAKGTNTKRPR